MRQFFVPGMLLGAMALSLAAQSGPLPIPAQASGTQEVHQASSTRSQSDVTLPVTPSIFYNFGRSTTDAITPSSSVMRASDGNFYGVTAGGGAHGAGALYRLTPSGQETVVYSFTGGDDGGQPQGTPVQASDGNLYGATPSGGSQSGGTVYQYNLNTGVLTTVYTQQYNTTGGPVYGNLIDGGNGVLYGATYNGGDNSRGSVWSFNYSTSTFTTLYSFSSTGSSDGRNPNANLVLAMDGNLYGTTPFGGSNHAGVAFMLGTDGSNFQVIHQFARATDGSGPTGLVQYSDGDLYGFTSGSGPNGEGTFFQIAPSGASSTFKVLYSFTTPGDGYSFVNGGPTLIGGDGKFYIASQLGGVNNAGQVMQLDNLGSKANVYDFALSSALAQLFESTDGNLYGVTAAGDGTNGDGDVYQLPVGLPPAITLIPSSSSVAQGAPLTLTWAVTNAFSKDAQVCIARSTDNSWSGSVATSGSVTVTPTSPGAVLYALTCGGVESATTTVNVGNGSLAVATAALPNGTIGAAYSATLAATNGTTPYTWSITSGSLPLDLSLAAGTGVISGTATQNGADNFVVQVRDSEGTPATASASLGITITATPLTITTGGSLPNGRVGDKYSQTLAASDGTAPYSWSVSTGSLPAGLSLDAGAGVISGTPTAVAAASFGVQVIDSESSPADATANFQIIVTPPKGALPAVANLIYNFDPTIGDGVQPQGGVIQASDGNFYGTAVSGGAFSNGGTFYKLTASGRETILYSFSGTSGFGPASTPVQASDGNIYFPTAGNGSAGAALYQYNVQTGVLTSLSAFTGSSLAVGDLIDDGNGILYGTTMAGGIDSDGSVWSYNYQTNTFTTLYSFTGGSDGKTPEGGLVLASDGNLYGLTQGGGAGFGTVYVLGTDGSNFNAFYTFTGGTDGVGTSGALVQYSDGNLYGFSNGQFGGVGNGAFFKIVPQGAGSTSNSIYQFQSSDGISPAFGRPLIGGDGKFYISGSAKGTLGYGQVMRLDSLGNKADVYDFAGYPGGDRPYSQPLESTDGNLYGTTYLGGSNDSGSVYQLLTYLPPVITLTSTSSDVALGGSITLTWAVTNAYSKNARVCIARSTDKSWTGPVDVSGSASVTPTASGAVFYSLTCGGVESAIVIINGDTPLVITNSSLPGDLIFTPYSAMLAASGGTPPYFFSVSSGSLPQGLSLAAGTGVISGTPTQAGTDSFAVLVTDSQGTAATAAANLSIKITSSALAMTTTSLSGGAVGAAYTQPLAASGGITPYTWKVSSGSLPPGLSLTSGSGVISGTPTTAGTSAFTVQVADSESTPASVTTSFNITINIAPPAIATTALPSGMVGNAYSQTLAASGGTAPYTWRVTRGELPAGLSLATSTGIISGTPTTAQTSNFTVQVADSESTPATAAANLSLIINQGAIVPILPMITASVNPSTVTTGQSTTITANLSGPAGSPTPTGLVQFLSNGANLDAPVGIAPDGTATLPSQVFSTAGVYSIAASYVGDTVYASANSGSASLTVNAPAVPAVTANPSTVTISAPGGTGSTTLTLANFSTSSITLACTGLPTGAVCSFGALNGSGGSTTSVLKITTTGTAISSNSAPPANHDGSRTTYALALPGLLAFAGLFTARRRQSRQWFVLLLLLSAGFTLAACGGGKGVTSNPNATPVGTSTVTVTAIAGTQSATQNISLVVQ